MNVLTEQPALVALAVIAFIMLIVMISITFSRNRH